MTFAVGFEIFHNSMPKPKEMMATFGIRTEDVAMKITARIADIVAAEVTYHFEIISAMCEMYQVQKEPESGEDAEELLDQHQRRGAGSTGAKSCGKL